MNLADTLLKARAKIEANQYITTDQLMDKALYMDTPWGKAIIESVVFVYTRRVNQQNIRIYRITLSQIPIKSLLTTADNIWKLVG